MQYCTIYLHKYDYKFIAFISLEIETKSTAIASYTIHSPDFQKIEYTCKQPYLRNRGTIKRSNC